MVKVVLEYNPYLMEFNAKFNGKEPHVNSLVEKYQKTPLQIWIKDVPHILYDEMNGYDFDLEFIGPYLEYEDIVKSFEDMKISSEDVRCTHIKSMESRTEKLAEIMELIQWMDDHRNVRFDLETFKIENPDIFDNSHSIIIIGDTNLGEFSFNNTNVSIEVISNINELDNTELKDIPMVIDAERLSIQDLQTILYSILKDNSDVTDNQFFIYVRSKNKTDMYYRLLIDIGFKKPQIINSLESISLKRYFEYYTVSDYIREYLCCVRRKVNELKSEMEKEKEESDKTNSEVMSQIMMIEEHISDIKDSIVGLDGINKTTVSPEWDFTKSKMLEKINTWKIKKTKITSNDEAVKFAEQFEEEIKFQWGRFIEIVKGITIENKNKIMEQCTEYYDKANKSKSSICPSDSTFDSYMSSFDGIKNEFLKIKEEHYEKPREGLLNSFLKEINVTNLNSKEAVLVTTYSCQKWREYAAEIATPLIDQIIEERNAELQEYNTNVSLDFSEKLIKLLDERIDDKNRFSSRLSDDIQVLQKDFDWLYEFLEKIEAIERN
ncbi:MAG: hypothetical protein K6E27_04770 [Eubacterium sp.]|nr:hypothetical protein [Eubacterium sp.]